MPRYVIERDFGQVSEDDLQEVAARSKVTASEHFPDIRWEHSHVCAGDDGDGQELLRLRGAERGPGAGARAPGRRARRHHVYEIVGDLTPEEVRV